MQTTAQGGMLPAFMSWKPWIVSFEPYVPPPDPPHVTLFYDRQNTEWYQEQFQSQLEGKHWQLSARNLYVAPQGVAAEVELSDEQAYSYLSDEAVPHVSLALHPQYEAKELGGMVKRAKTATDWQSTPIPQTASKETSIVFGTTDITKGGGAVSSSQISHTTPHQT